MANKYIDAEKLNAEIERLNSLASYESEDRHDDGLHDAYKAVKSIVTSLQQEQPEVDLEKEIYKLYDGKYHDTEDVARHFYKLGLNARKEG